MAKTLKATSEKVVKPSRVAATVMRDAKTGQSVTVKGVGALEGNDFKIKKGVNLVKPIAKQVLAEGSKKRKAG